MYVRVTICMYVRVTSQARAKQAEREWSSNAPMRRSWVQQRLQQRQQAELARRVPHNPRSPSGTASPTSPIPSPDTATSDGVTEPPLSKKRKGLSGVRVVVRDDLSDYHPHLQTQGEVPCEVRMNDSTSQVVMCKHIPILYTSGC